MSTTMSPRFDDADALDQLCRADPAALDTLDYGVIGFWAAPPGGGRAAAASPPTPPPPPTPRL